MEKDISLVVKSLNTAINTPGVRINREEYLRATFCRQYDDRTVEAIITTSPLKAGVSNSIIEKMVEEAISSEKNKTTLFSFGVGSLNFGGITTALVASVGDISFYFATCLRLAQKMAYLYGWQDIDIEHNPNAKDTLTVFLGCMLGVEAAGKVLSEIGEAVAKEMLQKTIQRKILEALGLVVSRDLTKRALSKCVPVIGGFVSGGISWFIFQKNAERLHEALKKEKSIY